MRDKTEFGCLGDESVFSQKTHSFQNSQTSCRIGEEERLSIAWIMGLLYGTLMIPLPNRKALLLAFDRKRGLMKISSHFSFDSPAFYREIFQDKVYEREYAIQHGDIVVDCGAHVGMFTIKAAERAALVISIEPVKKNLDMLTANIRRFGLKNVIVVGKALGSKTGLEKILVGKRSGTSQLSSVSKQPEPVDHEELVEVETLDNIVSQLGLSRIDLLKLDVEGAELEVLKGEMTKNIAMELHSGGLEVKEYLEKKGFEVKIFGNMLYAKKR